MPAEVTNMSEQRNHRTLNRRRFLQGSSAALVALSSARSVRSANEKIVGGVMGTSRNEMGGDVTHIQDFLDAIRQGTKLHAEIEEGYKSVLLCHLGNISYRLGRTIHLDAATHQIAGDKDAAALWSREYRPGWEPTLA